MTGFSGFEGASEEGRIEGSFIDERRGKRGSDNTGGLLPVSIVMMSITSGAMFLEALGASVMQC